MTFTKFKKNEPKNKNTTENCRRNYRKTFPHSSKIQNFPKGYKHTISQHLLRGPKKSPKMKVKQKHILKKTILTFTQFKKNEQKNKNTSKTNNKPQKKPFPHTSKIQDLQK